MKLSAFGRDGLRLQRAGNVEVRHRFACIAQCFQLGEGMAGACQQLFHAGGGGRRIDAQALQVVEIRIGK